MKKKRTIVIILTIVVLIVAAGLISLNVLTQVDKNSICENVYIDTLNIGNMSKEQAQEALDAYVAKLGETEVIVNVKENQVKTTLNRLGFAVDEHSYIEDAMNAGKEGNLIQRFNDLRKIKTDRLVYDLHFSYDDKKIDKLIKTSSKYDVKPKNAVLTRKNGKFQATEAVDGMTLDQEKTKDDIKEALKNWNKTGAITLDATVGVQKAEITKEQALLCNTVLGTYSTSYASSSSNRRKNVQNGASRINGTVLYPGEEFSASKTMGPFDESTGYALAGSYLNGKTVESFGGGVCQVSTTLYNALLLSELEITQRYNHSMTVSYVKPSMDAAISGTSKDLRFKNNTDAPIYIEANASGGRLTFNIWGHETRPKNRTIEYVSEVVETIQPGNDVITEDPTLPSTYRKVESSAHQGCRANLYKVVYVDGVQQSKEKINSSYYSAAPNYITVGTKVEEPKPTPTPTVAPQPSAQPEQKPEATPEAQTPTAKPSTAPTVAPSAKPQPTVNATAKPQASAKPQQ